MTDVNKVLIYPENLDKDTVNYIPFQNWSAFAGHKALLFVTPADVSHQIAVDGKSTFTYDSIPVTGYEVPALGYDWPVAEDKASLPTDTIKVMTQRDGGNTLYADYTFAFVPASHRSGLTDNSGRSFLTAAGTIDSSKIIANQGMSLDSFVRSFSADANAKIIWHFTVKGIGGTTFTAEKL